MAEAALFSLASKVLSMISSAAFEKAYESARSFWGAKGGLEELKKTIETIQAKLLDAEKKQRYSAAVKNWIDRVRDVLYDAENLFDEIYTHYMMKQQVKGGKHKKEVWGFFSKLNPIASRDSIAKKVKGIRKSLSEISSAMALFGFVSCNTEEERWVSGKGRETGCFVDPNDVIGRDDEKQEVLDFLYDESCVDLNISVISILGMGGMGKSTLAQLVYNDGEIAKDFKYRFWACISDIWDERKLIGKIYQSMTGKQYDRLSLDDLQESIREFITGLKGRFILVLDDLWDEDRARGIKLWSLLSSDVTKGSKIIVTTRNASVAGAYNAADRILSLKGLSNDASWKLFKRFAFSEEQEGDPTWISLGQKIVKKCVNVPLTIKTIAKLLRIKNTMEEWRSFEDEELSKNARGENRIMNALRLSYDHLPSHLKNCFAYCSLFPKDSSLDKQDLIYLWIAQGYVKPRLNEYLYDAGNAYFMELLRRSFFQEEPIPKPDSLLDNDSEGDSGIRRYKMHDLVHDLAQCVSGYETRILTTRAHMIHKRVRHLSVASEMDDTWRIAQALVEVDRLRSLLFYPAVSRGISRVLDQQVTKWRFLHALDFRRQGIEEVPFSIGKLKYLRYLNLSENRFSHLPGSLTKLVNLLTLDISKCELLEELPENIDELMNLRHLVNSTCDKLWRLPPSLGELTSLEHLSEYKLTIGCDGDDASLLARLNLGGKLKIFLRDSEGGLGEEETFEIMHIPDTIEELVIVWHSGVMRIPTWWREDGMSKLECLELFGSDGVKKLPPLRRLPRLKVLSLSDFRELEYVEEEGGVEEAGSTLFFPCLVKLELREMPKLRGWFRRLNEEQQPPAVIMFHRLSELRIACCPILVTMPLAPRLQLLLLAGTTAELVSLLLPTCSRLSSLRLKEIKGLTSLMCEGLTSLRKVHLVELKDLRDVSLPPNLVEELTINHCGELNLWENTEEGEIGLNKIPEPEKLPSSLQQLVSLGKLKIKLDYGWHLISHIPEIRLVHQHNQIIHKPNSSSSSKVEGDRPTYPSSKPERIGWDKVEAEGKNEVSSPSPPPPPPPRSFHQDSGLFSTRKITRNRGFDSQGAEYNKEGLQQKESDVELEVSEYSEIERESLSKGILFLLGNGYEFEKEKLVQLWMALGSIKEEPMEINGATYFDKLLSEEYLLSSDSNSMYKVNAERVKTDSDMIQNKPKFLVVKSTNQHNIEPDEILHVSVLCDGSNDAIIQTLHKFKKLITLLFHASCGPRIEQLSLDRSLSSESLLALDLSGAEIKELPSFVGQMGQLRYLDLSWTLVEHLPEAVTCLKWLQTLRLRGCSRIQRLPSNMEMLTELRHLDLNILGQLKVMPKGLGRLIKLRTLSAFVVGTQEGYDIKELRDLSNLSGDFCIAKLENVRSVDDAKCASMNTKFFFRKLDLRWSDFTLRDLQNEVSSDSVLNNLRPHLDLEELIIRCYAGTSLPNWIADEASFHKLARITLFKCEHVSMLPSIQKLPSVEYLELVSLNSVITVDVRCEIGHVAFPKLQTLIIDEMLGTETWTAAEEVDFPCLIELTISNCPTLSDFPSLLYLTSVKRLEMSSCPRVKFLPGKKLSSSLENLILDDCPLFVESCREKEWELIKHVPNVWIDQEAIFEETDCSSDVVGEDYYDDNDDDDDSTEDENGYNHLVD